MELVAMDLWTYGPQIDAQTTDVRCLSGQLGSLAFLHVCLLLLQRPSSIPQSTLFFIHLTTHLCNHLSRVSSLVAL
jgi:hypothetical protein